MTSLAYMRWDPRSRAGAIMVKKQTLHDLKAVEALSENVTDWAKYQNLAGECDTVETSPVSGPYDWRSYIQEETKLAQRREADAKPVAKKTERPAASSAPSVFYA
ncbi:MAG TPA: hypothetical protein VM370_07740 [Candidatus Thermoplasmatota archaeon]|nr:hypothetical protein [Candidatus Thermoplasmatota archaeon]